MMEACRAIACGGERIVGAQSKCVYSYVEKFVPNDYLLERGNNWVRLTGLITAIAIVLPRPDAGGMVFVFFRRGVLFQNGSGVKITCIVTFSKFLIRF